MQGDKRGTKVGIFVGHPVAGMCRTRGLVKKVIFYPLHMKPCLAYLDILSPIHYRTLSCTGYWLQQLIIGTILAFFKLLFN